MLKENIYSLTLFKDAMRYRENRMYNNNGIITDLNSRADLHATQRAWMNRKIILCIYN